MISRRQRRQLAHHARIGGGILTCALFLFPVLWMVLTSFKQQRDVFTTPPLLFFTPTLSAYTAYLRLSDVPGRMLNTVIVAGGSALLSIVAGSMAGYALARIRLRGAKTIGTLILLSRGVPPIALAVPMFLVARSLGLTDKHITLILAWEELLFALVLTNRNAVTIPVAVAGIAADMVSGVNWAALCAVGTIAVIPVVIFALAVQKWLIRGLADGATKG